MKTFSTLIATALLCGTALSAAAADLPTAKGTPTFVAAEAQSPWMIRVRALGVIPQESAKFYTGGVQISPLNANISASLVPELDITYFFTKNIAAELVLGTTPPNISLRGVFDHYTVGRVWLLPPTLTIQYHFTELGAFKPYIGAGVNYTFFYDEKAKGAFTSLNVQNQVGFALQAGFDYMFTKNWGVNVDVKKIWLQPDAKATLLGVVPVTAKVKIDPWLVGVGVTYRF
jgi:outer membrane protein